MPPRKSRAFTGISGHFRAAHPGFSGHFRSCNAERIEYKWEDVTGTEALALGQDELSPAARAVETSKLQRLTMSKQRERPERLQVFSLV
jgi:hypothetical protein